MHKKLVLVIYTSHRADCLQLCLDSLSRNTHLESFHHIYIIANAVTIPHLLLAKNFCEQVRNAHLLPCSPRGLVPAVMTQMNQILEKHRDDLIVKIDEDVFVTPGWLDALLLSHVKHKNQENILFSAALCPISATGYSKLYPVIEAKFKETLSRYAGCSAPLNNNKLLHRYVWEMILEGDLEAIFQNENEDEYLFSSGIVINCILFDRSLIDKIYPFPIEIDSATGMACVDELAINRALQKSGTQVAIPKYPFVHHYSHWRAENYLRRHVPLTRIRNFLFN